MNTEATLPEPGWTTRDFRPADAPALYALLAASKPDLPDEASFAARLAEAWVRVACEADGAPLGFAAIALPGRVEAMFVSPAARRQGVGSALLDDLYFLAAAMGGQRIEVETCDEDRPFFTSQGFEPTGGVAMEKRLSA